MKVIIFNTFCNDGGASKATLRIHKALLDQGIESKVVVMFNKKNDSTIIGLDSTFIKKLINNIRLQIDFLPLRFYIKRKNIVFTNSWRGVNVKKIIRRYNPDLCLFTWTSAGFIKIEDISSVKIPIIWRLSDSWAFTGGCHVPGDCTNYAYKCGKCPILSSNCENDLSRINWKRKQEAYKKSNITVVCPSNWLAGSAKKSALFAERKIETIPNAIDINFFKPGNKQIIRSKLNLPASKFLIMFGASNSTSDYNKGLHLLIPAINNYSKTRNGQNTELIIFGSHQPINPPDFGLKANFLGQIKDEEHLNLLYSSADIFIAPSLQDNSANTVLESLSCGTPCLAFNASGMPDLIEHKVNGYLARAFEIDDLENGITWLFQDLERLSFLGANARQSVVKRNSDETIAKKYVQLFNEILVRS